MDRFEATWERLAGWIASRELCTRAEVEEAAIREGLLKDPQALERARGLLDQFWDLVHQDPSDALGRATLASAVASRLGPADLRAELCRRRATALYALGRTREAVDVLKEGLEHLEAAEGPAEEVARIRAAILGFLGNAHLAQGQVRSALVALEEAIAIARQQGLNASLGAYLSGLGNARIFSGDTHSAEEDYAEALRIARKHGNKEGEAVNLGNLGLVRHSLGDLEQALTCYEAALILSHELGDRRSAGTLEANIGLVLAEQGDLEGAVRRYDVALELARVLEDPVGEALALLRLASVTRERGALEEAARLLADARSRLVAVDDPRRSSLLDEEGRIQLERGDVEGARESFCQALEAARAVGDRRNESVVLYDMGRAAHLGGRPAEAMAHLQEALVAARELGDRDVGALVDIARAEALLSLDDVDGAEAALEAAGSWVAKREGSLLEARFSLAKAALLARSRPAEARSLLDQTLVQARQRGFAGIVAAAERRSAELEERS